MNLPEIVVNIEDQTKKFQNHKTCQQNHNLTSKNVLEFFSMVMSATCKSKAIQHLTKMHYGKSVFLPMNCFSFKCLPKLVLNQETIDLNNFKSIRRCIFNFEINKQNRIMLKLGR